MHDIRGDQSTIVADKASGAIRDSLGFSPQSSRLSFSARRASAKRSGYKLPQNSAATREEFRVADQW
jgi:hypothetical protein